MALVAEEERQAELAGACSAARRVPGSEVTASLRRISPNGARSVFNSELKSIRRPRGAKNRPAAVGKPAGLCPGPNVVQTFVEAQQQALSRISNVVQTFVEAQQQALSRISNVVQTFVEAQQQALSRISVLEEEITSHKNHISTLKRELSEACRREMDQDEVVDRLAPDTPYGTRSAPRYAADRSYREDFAPLRGEVDTSYSILKGSPTNRRGTSMATPHISDRLRSPTRLRTPSPTRTRPLPRDYSTRNFSNSRR
ncbi:hypothetical protein Bbelb_231340 [Branchiostoma belcheri]|nr:hypothetical protein Bbelb_231340 [Branchiostoma belcheri]